MQNIIYIVIIVVVAIAAFYVGLKVSKSKISSLSPYMLNEQIKIQHSPSQIGAIPAGSTIYEYDAKGETTTYLVFFNLKNQMVIKPINYEHKNTIDPLSGYVE